LRSTVRTEELRSTVHTEEMMSSEDPENQAAESKEEQMTADEYQQVAHVLTREERWEDLAALFIERAETATSPGSRSRHLVHAALVFEKNLGDAERAYLTLLAAFQDDPANEEATAELARISASLGRFPQLLEECMAVAVQLTPPEKQAAMYVALATWFRDQVGDVASSEKALEAAVAADPTHPAALRALVDGFKLRRDFGRAAACLASAAAAAPHIEMRVGYGLDAAELYRSQLSNRDAACEQYRRVLEAEPTNRRAAEALAEIGWEAKDWTTVLPLFESLATATDGGGVQAARMFQRAGWAAQMLGDNDRARVNYRNAHGVDPAYLPALLRWASLALSEKWWQDVVIAVPAVLARPDAGLTQDEQIESLAGLGQAQLALGDAEAAAAAFTKVLAMAPDNKDCREALALAHGRLSGQGPESANAIIAQQRLLVQGASSVEEKFEILSGIAQSQREQLGDVQAALKTYFEMLELKTDDAVTLHEVFEIYTQAREWTQAVEILERLVRVEVGKTRARLLVAMGNILNYELGITERALDVYNLVLDEDVDDERTFGRIERILTAQDNWREMARNYRRMIKRLGTTPPEEKRAQLLALWRKLGDVCRRRLHEREDAVAAYEVCVQLAPEDRRYREILAEIYELLGPTKLNQAIKARESLLEGEADLVELAKPIREMARLFGKHQMYDRLHCTSAALVAMGQAIPQEQAYYERTMPPEIPRSHDPLAESVWQRFVSSPRQEWCVSHVLAVVSAGVAMARAKDVASLGLNPAQKVDLATDPSSVGRLIAYTCQTLGVALPPVYVSQESAGELELRIVLEGQQVVPSFLLGRDLLTERSERELAFYIGRKLVRLRADQFLLAPEVVSSLAELRVIIAATVKLVHPEFDLPGTDAASVGQYVAFLKQTVQPAALASATAAIEQIVADPRRVDLDVWAAGANQSADRAGLLLCGDVVSGVREVLRASETQGGDAEGALKDLIRWSVSSDYLDLREQLGLTTEVSPDQPVRNPEPFPRRPYKPA
jgi:tetratricopeptide (TPR) repeat protein